MSAPLYVPVLPTRPHTADAYRRLSPDIQSAVAPLWSIPPRTGLSPSLAAAFSKDVDTVAKVQRYHGAWLDAPFADQTQRSALGPMINTGSIGSFRGRPIVTRPPSALPTSGGGSHAALTTALFMPEDWGRADFAAAFMPGHFCCLLSAVRVLPPGIGRVAASAGGRLAGVTSSA
ncbi:MAG: beta family protein [Streptomyces sp.]